MPAIIILKNNSSQSIILLPIDNRSNLSYVFIFYLLNYYI